MRTLTPQQAHDQRYAAITIEINPSQERHMIANFENDMRGCDAVWIKSDKTGFIAVARKTSDIKKSK